MVLKYPDSETDLAVIQARLVLCTLMQGNLARGRAEFDAFRKAHPQASGQLAGGTGNLVEILKGRLAEAEKTPLPVDDAETATFAVDAGAMTSFRGASTWGESLWSVPWKEMRVERTARTEEFPLDGFGRSERGPATLPFSVLSYFPVAWKNVVFYCDETSVYAYELTGEKGGKPAWGNDPAIYKLSPEFDVHAALPRSRAGCRAIRCRSIADGSCATGLTGGPGGKEPCGTTGRQPAGLPRSGPAGRPAMADQVRRARSRGGQMVLRRRAAGRRWPRLRGASAEMIRNFS